MTYTDHFPTQNDRISFLGIKLLFGESRKPCLVLTTQQLVQLHLTQFLWCETQKTACHTINHQDLYQTKYEYCNLSSINMKTPVSISALSIDQILSCYTDMKLH